LVVVPCGSAKVWDKRPNAGPTAAADAYTGGPFTLNRKYAERFGDEWVILSAKYGFLRPADPVPGPYNVTFKRRSSRPVESATLRRQVGEFGLSGFDEVVGLGGKDYRLALEEAFRDSGVAVRFPFAGLNLFQMMRATKQALDAD
jgi:hypothetical protein